MLAEELCIFRKKNFFVCETDFFVEFVSIWSVYAAPVDPTLLFLEMFILMSRIVALCQKRQTCLWHHFVVKQGSVSLYYKPSFWWWRIEKNAREHCTDKKSRMCSWQTSVAALECKGSNAMQR